MKGKTIKNTDPKHIELIQLFKESDGVYLQFFRNSSSTLLWKHKVTFSYKHMKFYGSRKKNVKLTNKGDISTQIITDFELEIRPGDEYLILICQEDGEPFEL